ncbi:MAG: ROK family protein [Bifidobacteriaceae bacterium]|nr:ROK family protein [Bifidobacteriaceae bacterium]
MGATNIKCAAVRIRPGEEPRVSYLETLATVESPNPVAVRRQVEGIALGHLSRERFEAVGLAFPGTVDTEAGTTGVVPNIEGDWNGFSLSFPISQAIGVPVRLINDARAFALAEARAGAARGLDTAVFLTLGTGIGGGVIIGGRLHRGRGGIAGEIGHQVLDTSDDAPRCGCGNTGCLEALALPARMCQAAGQTSVRAVFAAAAAGDGTAAAALAAAIRYIAVGLANVNALLCPDAFVVGGGIAQAGEALRRPLVRELRRRVTLDNPEAVDVRLAQLGHQAGAVGAAFWALEPGQA